MGGGAAFGSDPLELEAKFPAAGLENHLWEPARDSTPQRNDAELGPRSTLNPWASAQPIKVLKAACGSSLILALRLPCPKLPQHMLSLLSLFKNESHILAEWIDSHAAEGVDRIFLVNNNSDDDFQTAIASARNANLVTLLHDERVHAQATILNEVFRSHILPADCEWLIICDLDEFVYARNEFNTIKDYLRTLPEHISLVSLPWKMFGSSGFSHQPQDGVTRNFIWRDDYPDGDTELRPGMPCPGWINCKYIIRCKQVACLDIHNASLFGGDAILANGQACNSTDVYQPISNSLLANLNLHLNHYAIQSRDFFERVKMKRGSAASAGNDLAKQSWDYFERFDRNLTPDHELANKNHPLAVHATSTSP